MTTLAEAAVLLAQRGNRVFPTGADKAPRTQRGFHDGTTDIGVIEGWDWTGGGIGLVIPDRVFVVDVDPRNGGDETLEVVQRFEGTQPRYLPATRMVRTQSGGRHYYFAIPRLPRTCGHTFVLSSCEECQTPRYPELRGSLGPGVDIKKPGRGYVLVPPSPGYTYLRGGKPAPAPQWLLDELTIQSRPVGYLSSPKYFALMGGTGYGLATLRNALERIRTQGEGGRRALLNAEAYTLGGLVAGGELDEDKALEGLLAAALESGLSEKDALSRIHSGWCAGLLNPRSAE